MFKNFRFILLTSNIYLLIISTNFVLSDICNPHDPEGLNPDSLCINHYHQNFGNQFQIQGNGTSAYHGKSNDFRFPGKRVIKNPLNSDFFTNVSTGDKSNGIIIKTNKGKVYKFDSE